MVGEAGDMASARAAVRDSAPDVLVLDVNLPDGLAVDAVAGLREESPGTEIVLLTMERDLTLARRAIDSGARGYLFKDAAHLELIEAVRHAAEGREYLPPAVEAGLEGRGRRRSGRALAARDRGAAADGAGPHKPRDRRAALAQRADGGDPPRPHPAEAWLDSRPELTRYALENA